MLSEEQITQLRGKLMQAKASLRTLLGKRQGVEEVQWALVSRMADINAQIGIQTEMVKDLQRSLSPDPTTTTTTDSTPASTTPTTPEVHGE
jgi:hypothetical protein